jgi:N-acetylglucosaminyldiphosphoundecaprenol N-acetyl-beta-D-mannosaminyltransferase
MSAPAAPALPRTEILGTTVHPVTLQEALDWVDVCVAARTVGYVVTLNGALLVQTARQGALRALVNEAALVTADGIGVLLAARILGVALPERLTGIDLAAAVCRRAAERGHRVYLLGGAPGVAAATAQALQARHPLLQIAGAHHGYYTPDEEQAVVAEVRHARPDVLLVALGAPRQEFWMRQWKEALGVPVSIGVGGSFDVLAGRVPRAPRWMQRLGLEWLYRAVREPRRWGVVRTIPPLFLMALRARLRGRSRGNRGVDTMPESGRPGRR